LKKDFEAFGSFLKEAQRVREILRIEESQARLETGFLAMCNERSFLEERRFYNGNRGLRRKADADDCFTYCTKSEF